MNEGEIYMLTPKQVSSLLNIHPATVIKFIHEGLLDAVNLTPGRKHGTYRISTKEIQRVTGMLVVEEHGDFRLESLS